MKPTKVNSLSGNLKKFNERNFNEELKNVLTGLQPPEMMTYTYNSKNFFTYLIKLWTNMFP